MTTNPATFALFLTALLFGTVAGAGLYQRIAVMPGWFASPPASFSAIGGKRDRTFWIPLQSAALLSLVFAVVMNWGIAERRTPLLVAAGANLLVWIATGVYFVPEILRFTKIPKDAPSTPGLVARGRRWLRFQWGRILLLVVGQAGILLALSYGGPG
jgi:hypothetical protein